jgi:hypothetical protein
MGFFSKPMQRKPQRRLIHNSELPDFDGGSAFLERHKQRPPIGSKEDFIRQFVFERDRGICAKCGLNCERLWIAIQWYSTWVADKPDFEPCWRFVRQIGRRANLWPRCLWQVDHILAVSLGGDNHPSNLQTLCLECHGEKTKADLKLKRGGA